MTELEDITEEPAPRKGWAFGVLAAAVLAVGAVLYLLARRKESGDLPEEQQM